MTSDATTIAAVLRTTRQHRQSRKSSLCRRILGTGIAAVFAGAALWMPGTSAAATITWGSATGISGDTDVSTTGALVGALALGTSGLNPTVNGVTFTGVTMSGTSVTSGDFTITAASSLDTLSTSAKSGTFSTLSTAYQALLGSSGYDDTSNFTLTISGLVVGSNYSFEWFRNDSGGTNYTTTATAGNSITLNGDPSATVGGVGQYSIGTFTADSTSESIIFAPGSALSGNLVNGFELRGPAVPATHWLGGVATDGKWTTISNWAGDQAGTPATQIPTSTDDVTFSATGVSGSRSTTLEQDFTIHSLTDNDTTAVVISSGTGGPYTLTIAGNAGTGITVATGANLTINSNVTFGGSSDTIEVDGTGLATITGVLGGGNGLIKTGAGTLALTAVETFSGGTTVNGGTLQLGDGTNPASLPTGGTVTVNNAASFTIMAHAAVAASDGGSISVDVGDTTSDGAPAIVFSNGGTLTNNGSITAGNGGGQSAGVNNTLGNGGAGVIFSSGGTLINTGTITAGNGGGVGSGVNTVAGNGGAGVVFSNGGTLTNSGTISGGAGGSLGGVNTSGGAGGQPVTFTGAAGAFNNLNHGVINGTVSMGNFANAVTLQIGSAVNGDLNIGTSTAATLTLTDDGIGGTQTYSTAVTGTTTFSGALTKAGTGTWTLDKAFTYTGATTVSAGTLNITGTSSGAGSFAINGTSTLTINSSGTVAASGVTFGGTGTETLNLNGGTFLVGAGGLSTPSTNTALVFNGGTLQSSAAFTISSDLPIAILSNSVIDTSGGNISSQSGFGNTASPGNLTIQGGNTLTGAFDSTMTGEILVTGNTTLAMASASTASGLLSIASGSKLDLNNSSASFGGLTGAGAVINSTGAGVSTLAITGTGGNTFSGVISAATPADTAVAINLTSGAQTFTGANTYGGGTMINGGTLLANNTTGSATGTGAVTINTGGTLGGSGTVGGAVTLNTGAFIAPGAGTPGVAGTTLHAASLAWNGGGTLTLQLGATADQLVLSGALTKLTTTVGPYTINILNAGIAQQAYTLATFASIDPGLTAGAFTLDLPAGYSGALLETPTSLVLALAFAASGNLIQNMGGPNTPVIADFTVTGVGMTGTPTESNTINSLTMPNGSSLLIFNTLTVTSGNVNQPGGSATITGGTLYGPNGLHFDVNGNLFIGSTLIGNAVKTGTGSLFLDGALYGNMSVLQGLLGGNGSILGNLFNASIVSPGHSPGQIHVSGNYTQSPTGTLVMQIGGASVAQHDLLSMGGTANLDGTLQLVRLNNFKLKRNESVAFLTANGGVHGKFANVVSDFTNNNTILDPTVIYGSNSVSLEAVQGSFAALAGLTPNQQAVARALDSATGDHRTNALFDYLDYRTLNKLPGDLDRIAPEELTSIFTLGVALANVQSLNIQRRTDDIRSGANGFNAAGLAINGGGPSYSGGFGLNTGVAGPSGDDGKEVKETKAVVPAEDRWGVFLSGTGEWVSVGNTDNARGYNLESGGFTLGVDYKVTPNLAIGLAGGYTGTTADLTDHGRIYVNGGKIGLYGTFFQNEQAAAPTMSKDSSKEAPTPAPSIAKGFYADVAVFGGYNSYDIHRSALQGEARSDADGGELNVLFGTGYDFKAGGLTFGPTATFNYTYLGLNSFTEHGSLAPLNVHGSNEESLRSAFGFKASYDWKVGGLVIKPELRAAWQHEYGDTAYAMNSSFANGAGGIFTVHGPQIGRDSALLGAGFAIQLNERTSIYAYYDGELGRTNYQATNVTGGFRLAF